MESYGEKLRRFRGNRTAKETAAKLGITVQALQAYESGRRIPRDEVKRRISAALLEGPNFFYAESAQIVHRKEKKNEGCDY